MTPQDRLERIKQYISKMPSLTTTVKKVLEICNDPNASPNDLNRVISLDPVLTGQVLKLINSAYYGLPNRIASLTRAIIMLGLNTVKNLVLATSVLTGFKGNAHRRDVYTDTFWEHSLNVGVTAKVLADLMEIPALEQEAYFVAGLLHDLGKLPMAACFAEDYTRMRLEAEKSLSSYARIERHLFGFDHCHVNRLIVAKWHLSKAMGNVLIYHHRPFETENRPDDLLVGVSLADCVINAFQGPDAQARFFASSLVDELIHRSGLEKEALFAHRSAIGAQIEKARLFLDIAQKG